MENINKYINKVNEYIKDNPDITEDMLVRYVFLDLSKMFSFDMDYIPFGNSKSRRDIYRYAYSPYRVDECFEKGIVICNTASKIFEMVLKRFDINVRTEFDGDGLIRNSHVFNVIKTKDGREYIVDIQEDMYRVQMNGRTPNYGLSLKDNKYVLSYYDQEVIDRRLGYISDDRYYTDDYLYLLKNDISYMDSLYDKVKFVLEHIEVFDNPDMSYIDREWFHVRILEFLFDKDTFDYHADKGSIKVIDTYRKINDERIPMHCILVEENGNDHFFVYKKDKNAYQEKSVEYIADSVNDGLVIHRNCIKSVEKVLRQKNKQRLG